LRDTGVVEIEALVVGTDVLVVDADDVASAAVPEGARAGVLQPVVGPEEVPGEAAAIVEGLHGDVDSRSKSRPST
jgi:hypothetical protein